MRFVRPMIVAAALAAFAVAGVTPARAVVRDARTAAAGRQKIRAELAAAMAKGRVTRMDQYNLLLHAKELLTKDDFQGFEQTLDRVVAQQGKLRTAAPVRSGNYAPDQTEDVPIRNQSPVRPSEYDETAVSKAAGSGAELVPTPEAGPAIEDSAGGIGRPTMQSQLEGDDAEASCDDCAECGRPRRHWVSLDIFTGVEGFKGPVDVGNANGNFGVRVGGNAAIPLFQRMGFGLQAGLATDITNLEGSPYPFPNASLRDQIFVTVGLFQRIYRCDGSGFAWGIAYDYLFDDYYTDFTFGQWRVKGEYDFAEGDAFGIQASVPERGSTGELPTFIGTVQEFPFRPISQGSMFWTHTFCNDASLTGRLGVAERPNNFVFGADSRVPVTQNLALTGTFTYIMPNTGAGSTGQTEEMWNVGVGLEFTLGGFHRGCCDRFRPYLPVADNGSLAIRQLQ